MIVLQKASLSGCEVKSLSSDTFIEDLPKTIQQLEENQD